MSNPAPAPRRAQAVRRRRPDRSGMWGDIAFLDGTLAVGVLACWPIYQHGWLLVLGLVAIALATGIVLLGARLRWAWWLVAAVTLGAYIVGGVPLAAPSALTDPVTIPSAFVEVVTAPVTGWKNLLTLDLPLGVYRATLAPLYLLVLTAGVLALSLAVRRTRVWFLAAPVTLLVTCFAVVFGSSALTGELRLGPWADRGVLETAVGVLAVGVPTAWYLWRAVHTRRAALRAAREATGVRSPARASRTVAARLAAAGGMVVLALVGGLLLAPAALAGSTRDALRTDIDPQLRVRAELSPLTDYRAWFSDDAYDEVMFRVSDAGGADRVRLATLSYYDGRVMQVVDPAAGKADTGTAFTRVPSTLTPAGGGTRVDPTIEVDGYRGIWVPTVGALTAISFSGDDRAALSDGFYYNATDSTGVELSATGLSEGAAYTQSAVVDPAPRDPATLTPSRENEGIDAAYVPESLTTWIESQDAPAGGPGLAELISRLRARGLLSHALTVDPAAPPTWMSDLGDYTFEGSRSGHSSDRIADLFDALVKKQSDVGGDQDSALVAAAGDDEQFAVAGALIADQLGFPARVVVGMRLSSDDDTLSVCDDGACTGGDLSAWIEVQDADGTWSAIDTTPQHTVPLSPDVQQRRDPRNPTEVKPQEADTVLPPEANPSDSGSDPEDPTQKTDLTWLWEIARMSGLVVFALLVLLSPLAVVLLAKAFRYRSRRRSNDPVDRVVAGWDEYVDTAVDHGRPAPPAATRTEVAAAIGGETGGDLAVLADRSVFAPAAPTEAETEAFWALVDEERRRMRAEAGFWRRWRARLSLRSFVRRLRELAGGRGPR